MSETLSADTSFKSLRTFQKLFFSILANLQDQMLSAIFINYFFTF